MDQLMDQLSFVSIKMLRSDRISDCLPETGFLSCTLLCSACAVCVPVLQKQPSLLKGQALEGDEGSLATCRANQEHNSQPFQGHSVQATASSHREGPAQGSAGFFQACSPVPNENAMSRTVVFCITQSFLFLFPQRVSACADC